jgi:hypothetical protein
MAQSSERSARGVSFLLSILHETARRSANQRGLRSVYAFHWLGSASAVSCIAARSMHFRWPLLSRRASTAKPETLSRDIASSKLYCFVGVEEFGTPSLLWFRDSAT